MDRYQHVCKMDGYLAENTGHLEENVFEIQFVLLLYNAFSTVLAGEIVFEQFNFTLYCYELYTTHQ